MICDKLFAFFTCVAAPALLVTESFLAAPECSLTTIVVLVDSPDCSCCKDEVARFTWLDLLLS